VSDVRPNKQNPVLSTLQARGDDARLGGRSVRSQWLPEMALLGGGACRVWPPLTVL